MLYLNTKQRDLLEIANSSNMEVVIIRPSLVYGPGVKGNFATMIKVVKFDFFAFWLS